MSHRFRVWAPGPDRVDVVLGDGRHLAMGRDGADPTRPGWWAADVDDAGPGTGYGFSLGGGPVRPDPRSEWQPEGPEGLSRLVDHDAFEWADRAWHGVHLPSAVIYELHVGTFSEAGTFQGVIPHLEHLRRLGVDLIELMPVAEFPGPRGWGYDGVDLFAPHHTYGGPDGLKRLVDHCHRTGLGVLLDVVYNHLGPSGNHLSEFGPYFSDRHTTPWGAAVNFDGPGSDEVRRFVVDNARMWLSDYHLDGLRLDAVHAIVDLSALNVLEQLSADVAELSAASGWRRWLVAESDLNDPRLVRSRDAGGYGLDAQWNDDFHHALHSLLTGESTGYYRDFGGVEDVARALRGGYVFDGRYSAHRHRRHGRPATGVGGWSFVGFSQNHDQVGNRARGERSTDLMSPGRLKVAAALVLTAPFIPLLFQGEEWAATAPFLYFTSHPDPELGRAVGDGRRREFAGFGWDPADIPDPQDPATFLRSRLDWSEPGEPGHAEVLEWYRQLVALRRAEPDLTDGRLDRVEVGHDGFGPDGAGWLVVTRGRVTVAANLSDRRRCVPVPGAEPPGRAGLALASEPGCRLDPGGVVLPSDSVVVLRTR